MQPDWNCAMRHAAHRHAEGFTLIELMVTVAILAVMLTIAAPNLGTLIQNNRATAHANDLVLAISIARAEAMRRSRPVSICPTSDQSSCAGAGDWANGWMVFADAATTGAPNPSGTGAEIIRVFPGASGNGAVNTQAAALRFTRNAPVAVHPAEATRRFTVEFTGCAGDQRRQIDVAPMGRARVTRQACT